MKMILIVLVMKLLVFIGETTDRQKVAIVRAMRRKGVAGDLMPLIAGRIPNDWFQLQKVFHLTDRTRPIFVFTELHGENPPRNIKNMEIPGVQGSVDVDEDGRIESINLSGMTHEDIADLAKLPDKLKRLRLHGGTLPRLNIDGLPDSIEVIKLIRNRLVAVTWTKLPTSLEQLDLMGNELTELDLRALPPKLRNVQLIMNDPDLVVTVDARMSPTYLSDDQTIFLKMNDAGTGCDFGINHKVRVMVDKGGVVRTI